MDRRFGSLDRNGVPLKLALWCGAGCFFPDIVVRFLISCVFCGLAGERLTLPAALFFILLCPCGPSQNSDEYKLWKSEVCVPNSDKGCFGMQLFIRRNTRPVNCTNFGANLLYGRNILQVNQLEITMQNAVANHLGGLALPELTIGIKSFLHARAAVGAVSALKAAAQAAVAMATITIAIARHLVHDRRNPGGSLIGFGFCRGDEP
jgi:hypothetical protein